MGKKGSGLSGHPSHQPTEDTRRTVSVMRACGDTTQDIALAIGVSRPTLNKHYETELDAGKQKMDAQVKGTLFRMAISGRYPAATFFYLKTKCGFREKDELEHSGEIKIKIIRDRTDVADSP